MDGSFKPITEVQDAESRAAKTLEKATKDREGALIDAKTQAAAMVQEAEARAKQQKADAITKELAQLDRRKKDALEAAGKDAKSYKTKRLNQVERGRAVKELVDLILGA
ncbi:MAG TPA: hypothetical protein VND15_02775 [Candidatus Acidoferrales bacterium]|nr:hypothetical protein [Candidatus Acidoferrales bacterium]